MALIYCVDKHFISQ